jgi:HemY protein
MPRVVFFILLVFALGLGFAWLADRPGNLVATFDGYEYQVSLMVAAVLVVAVVAAVMILWWLVKGIWNSPKTVARYFRVRRRDRGYQALSTGMIAAGAGDAAMARRKKKEAAKLISSDQEPLLHLLDAQASLLDGDHDAARAKFEAMLDDPELRLIGLRGLYLEALRLGERDVARHYAERASEAAPQLGWAADATLEARTAEGDWDAALRLVDAQKSTRQIDRESAQRRRAVLLTARAIEMVDADPAGARTAALEANRLAPELVPAAVIAAKALFRQNETRKGAKILEAAWKKEPHPEIAEAYVHARHGDSTHDRLERAKRLRAIKQNHAESALAVARAALDAGEFALARREAETAIRLEPREGAYLLLADIEEAETGDQGRIRQHLARALAAPRDPAWIADGEVAERWAPVSPVSGRLDGFEWKAPPARLGRLIEPDEPEGEVLDQPRLPVVPAPVIEVEHAEPAASVEAAVPPPVEEIVAEPEPVAAGPEPVAPPAPESAELPVSKKVDEAPPASAANDDAEAAPRTAPPREKAEPAGRRTAPIVALVGDDGPVGPARLPDDPGVTPEEAAEAEQRRFRLF